MLFFKNILKKIGLLGLHPILRWVVVLPFFIGFCLWGVLFTAIASPSSPATSTPIHTLTTTLAPSAITINPTKTNTINLAPTIAITPTISKTDREIDTLVYELYGLSDEEIKIVEGN